jgi:glycosyltransferase involved in cell wall biosynthesis
MASYFIGDSLEMTGELPNIAAIKEIAKSEVFICPSLAEGLGVVFIEAQACATPPIGTQVGGIPDVITDNENGLLIEPKNSEQIAEAIIKLLTNPEQREMLASRGLETSRRFEWSTIMDKIEGIYFDILK